MKRFYIRVLYYGLLYLFTPLFLIAGMIDGTIAAIKKMGELHREINQIIALVEKIDDATA